MTEAVRPGGWIVVSVPNMRSLDVLFQLAVRGDWPEASLDLDFSADFTVRAPRALARAVTSDCAIFYGGYEIENTPSAIDGWAEVAPTIAVRTTHFLVLKGMAITAAAAYLATMLEREAGHPEGGPMHVDGAYSWFRRAHPQYRTLAAIPALGYQRASRTDIHDLRWFDRIPGVLHAVAWLRRGRNGYTRGR